MKEPFLTPDKTFSFWFVSHEGLTIKFKEKEFNESQEVLERPNKETKELTRILREIGDWLVKNHKNLL